MLRNALKQTKGQALIEYTVIVALLILVAMSAISVAADQVLDIWNDLAEDLDSIDDYVAVLEVSEFLPESDEDMDSGEDTGW